jgi:2-phospho-L-lactate guanylyltransferase
VTVGVLVPLKPFASAKLRLAPALSPARRVALVQSMAERVVAAAGALPVSVVCEDDGVASWASQVGASVVRVQPHGLDHAVRHGVAALAGDGHSRVVVAHGDLPLATDLCWVADFPGVTLVPDRRGRGTNVACVPARAGFVFRYGTDSCAAHTAEATRLGLPLRVVADEQLGWDVDVPEDLAACPAELLAAG